MTVLFVLCYLLLGFILYRIRWPEGLFPEESNPERERVRRTGRRRVEPLPDHRREQEQPVVGDDEGEA